MILYEEDWAQQGASVHIETKNQSFINVAGALKAMGVKNHKFMLAIHNRDLIGIDPHNLVNPSAELIAAIATECKINIWYFLREVVRIPATGGDPIPFIANRGNIALTWVYYNNIDVLSIQPRQTGKTMGTQALVAEIIYLSGNNLPFLLLTKDATLVHENVARLKGIRDALPKYLILNRQDDDDNKEGLTYKSLGTKYMTKIARGDVAGADRLARGISTSTMHVDEICFCANIHITYPVMMGTTTKARENAALNGQPHSNIYTTTAGPIDTPEGEFVYKKLLLKSLTFTVGLYDLPNQMKLRQIVRANSENGMISMSHSYLQLGLGHDWFLDVTSKVQGGQDVIDREYLNMWKAGTGSSVLPQNILDAIARNKKEPAFTEYVGDYAINWYVPREVRDTKMFWERSYAIGMDSSEMTGRDYTALVIVDLVTFAVIATIRCNDSGVLNIAMFILELMTRFPRSVLIPERASTGASIIDILIEHLPRRGFNPYRRIYNRVVQERADDRLMAEINVSDRYVDAALRRYFGFKTSESSRKFLYKQILIQAISMNYTKLFDKTLITELCTLTTRNGRVDHTAGNHDDTVIAYLLCCYFVLSGRNFDNYDVDASTILAEAAYRDPNKENTEHRTRQEQLRHEIRQQERLVMEAPNRMVGLYRMNELRKLLQQVDQSIVMEPVTVAQASKEAENLASTPTMIWDRSVAHVTNDAQSAMNNYLDLV